MKSNTPTAGYALLGPFVFWVWFRKNGGAWKKANHTATSKEHAIKIMSFFQAQNKRNGRTDLQYVVSDILPNVKVRDAASDPSPLDTSRE